MEHDYGYVPHKKLIVSSMVSYRGYYWRLHDQTTQDAMFWKFRYQIMGVIPATDTGLVKFKVEQLMNYYQLQ